MADIELLNKVIDYALSEGNWDQNNYVGENECGTTYCIAGFTTLVFSNEWEQAEYGSSAVVNKASGEHRFIEHTAQEMLRLTKGEALVLFNASNDKDDILRIRDEIVARTSN